jgi:hypothetical protein
MDRGRDEHGLTGERNAGALNGHKEPRQQYPWVASKSGRLSVLKSS